MDQLEFVVGQYRTPPRLGRDAGLLGGTQGQREGSRKLRLRTLFETTYPDPSLLLADLRFSQSSRSWSLLIARGVDAAEAGRDAGDQSGATSNSDEITGGRAPYSTAWQDDLCRRGSSREKIEAAGPPAALATAY